MLSFALSDTAAWLISFLKEVLTEKLWQSNLKTREKWNNSNRWKMNINSNNFEG